MLRVYFGGSQEFNYPNGGNLITGETQRSSCNIGVSSPNQKAYIKRQCSKALVTLCLNRQSGEARRLLKSELQNMVIWPRALESSTCSSPSVA